MQIKRFHQIIYPGTLPEDEWSLEEEYPTGRWVLWDDVKQYIPKHLGGDLEKKEEVDFDTSELLSDSELIEILNKLPPLTKEQLQKLKALYESPEFIKEGERIREREEQLMRDSRIRPETLWETIG